MSVPSSKRKMSKTEFFDFAIRLNSDLVQLVLRNFGVKSVNRDLRAFTYSAKMSAMDAEVFKQLCKKYNIDIEASYPLFVLEYYRNRMLNLLTQLMDNIVAANTVYATTENEFNYRRQLQWAAIADCRKLLTTMQLAMQFLPVDANRLMPYVNEIQHEFELLKEWKKSDNKILQAIKNKNNG